jgi:hypothetical protein
MMGNEFEEVVRDGEDGVVEDGVFEEGMRGDGVVIAWCCC